MNFLSIVYGCKHRLQLSNNFYRHQPPSATPTPPYAGAVSDDDNSLSDNDLSSDEEKYSSNKVGRSSTRKHSPRSAPDEQRLLAYKKENKSWSWIFQDFLPHVDLEMRLGDQIH